MTLKIPRELKKEFKDGFAEYIKTMGRNVEVYLKPYQVLCPNCQYDSVQKKSTNIWNSTFLRPVNIFVGTQFQQTIFPQPFNVTTASGVVYDPVITNPKILIATVCPICKGEGILIRDNKVDMNAVVTIGLLRGGYGNTESPRFYDLSAGLEGKQVYRFKTYECNYATCRDAEYFKVDNIKLKAELPPRVKGLGGYHLTEMFLSEITEGNSVTDVFDNDIRTHIEKQGQTSNQAPVYNPTIPPIIPGDDVW